MIPCLALRESVTVEIRVASPRPYSIFYAIVGGMNVRTPTVFAVIAAGILSLLWFTLCPADEGPASRAVESLKSQDQKARISACNELQSQRQEIIRNLVGLLESRSPDVNWLDTYSTESLAIKLLGEMRAAESINYLIRWATPPEGGFNVGPLPPLHLSPAGAALIKIGKPAEPALLNTLRQKTEKPFWAISLEILKEIEGAKCLEVILGEAIAAEKAPEAKANLQAALRRLQGGGTLYDSGYDSGFGGRDSGDTILIKKGIRGRNSGDIIQWR